MENHQPLDALPVQVEEVVTSTEVGAASSSQIVDAPKTDHPRKLIAHLASIYPNTFFLDGRKVRPLAVGILKELKDAREGEGGHGLTMQELRRALRYYTQGAAYHRAVARGEARVNLAGEAVGEVSEEQKAHAEACLAELAPKLPKRPARPARKAAEEDGGEGAAERPRRPRKPLAARGETRAEGKGEGRKPRREARGARPVRSERPVRREEIRVPVLSAEEKLNLLLEKFGSK